MPSRHPLDIALVDGRWLAVGWDDGHRSEFPIDVLRDFCPCATCRKSPANLGPNYSKVSQPLWNAIQAALTGAKTPEQALKDAQQEAESAMQ